MLTVTLRYILVAVQFTAIGMITGIPASALAQRANDTPSRSAKVLIKEVACAASFHLVAGCGGVTR